MPEEINVKCKTCGHNCHCEEGKDDDYCGDCVNAETGEEQGECGCTDCVH